MTLRILLIDWHLIHRYLAIMSVRNIGVVSILSIFLRDVNLVSTIVSFLLVLPLLSIVNMIQICATLLFSWRLPFKLLRRNWMNLLDLGVTNRIMLLSVFMLS